MGDIDWPNKQQLNTEQKTGFRGLKFFGPKAGEGYPDSARGLNLRCGINVFEVSGHGRNYAP